MLVRYYFDHGGTALNLNVIGAEELRDAQLADDQHWKSPEIIRKTREHLKEIGANYLLNVGPDGLGRIPAPAAANLLAAQ